MFTINNKQVKKKYVIGGSGLLDSILQFLVRTFTSQGAKQIASSAVKEIGKATLDAGKNVAVEAGKKMVDKVMRPKTSNRIEQIVNKYITTTKGSAIAIQDLVKKLNNSRI